MNNTNKKYKAICFCIVTFSSEMKFRKRKYKGCGLFFYSAKIVSLKNELAAEYQLKVRG